MKGMLRSTLLHYLQGLLMGGADIIPGVSGGTMALIVGIYTRLIDSISSVFSALVCLLRGDGPGFRRGFARTEWHLVIPLGLGIITAVGIGSLFILQLMEGYPAQSRGLFFGLVAASVAIPWMRMRSPGLREAGVALAAAAVAFLLSGLPGIDTSDPGLLRVFAAAAVAICAMILPGISGAFLLEALGMYRPTLAALHALNVPYVLTFVAGAAVGLGLFSKLLEWLLEHRYNATMAALVGLMIGALRALWPWQEVGREMVLPGAGDAVAATLFLALLGFALITALTRLAARRIETAPRHATGP